MKPTAARLVKRVRFRHEENIQYMSFSSYLAVLADNGLFGLLAVYCLLVALAGLVEKPNTRTYRAMAMLGLLVPPVLHGAGSYFLSQAPA